MPITKLKRAAGSAVDQIEMKFKKRQWLSHVTTGFTRLDEQSLGFAAGELAIVASDLSEELTAFMQTILMHVSEQQEKQCLVMTGGISLEDYTMRLLSMSSGISHLELARGAVKNEDWAKLSDSLTAFNDQQVWLDDSMNPEKLVDGTLEEFVAEIGAGPDLLLIHLPDTEGLRELSTIVDRLKQIALETRAVVMVALPITQDSKLSRQLEIVERLCSYPSVDKLLSLSRDRDESMSSSRELVVHILKGTQLGSASIKLNFNRRFCRCEPAATVE